MAVRAPQTEDYNYQTAPQETQPTYTPQMPNPNGKKKTKLVLSSRIEKVLFLGFVMAFVALAVVALNRQSQIHTTNYDIVGTEQQISELQKHNAELKVQINDLSKDDRIWEKAKSFGLTQNEHNVKVVPGK